VRVRGGVTLRIGHPQRSTDLSSELVRSFLMTRNGFYVTTRTAPQLMLFPLPLEKAAMLPEMS